MLVRNLQLMSTSQGAIKVSKWEATYYRESLDVREIELWISDRLHV
jgi:hypothetical protein